MKKRILFTIVVFIFLSLFFLNTTLAAKDYNPGRILVWCKEAFNPLNPSSFQSDFFNNSYENRNYVFREDNSAGLEFLLFVPVGDESKVINQIKNDPRFLGADFDYTLLPKTDDDLYRCSFDEDCILVDNIVCGCSGGGTRKTINKDYQKYWQEKRSLDSIGYACPAVMSNHWTCSDAVVSCIANKCQLKKSLVKTVSKYDLALPSFSFELLLAVIFVVVFIIIYKQWQKKKQIK